MKVYTAIAAVARAMSHDGIVKSRKNQTQGYNFRGIDDVLNALSSALTDAGLVILPRVTSREQVERTTAKGSALFYTTVCVEFDLVAVEDGSKHTVITYGEAMDSADKATNKAMSAAYKYLALLTFCIPTEATPESEADFTTHDVKPAKGELAQTGRIKATDGAETLLSKDRQGAMDDMAAHLIEAFQSKDELGAIAAFYNLENYEHEEEKVYLWKQLGAHSKLRALLKANRPEPVPA